jgi:hypothetical protein
MNDYRIDERWIRYAVAGLLAVAAASLGCGKSALAPGSDEGNGWGLEGGCAGMTDTGTTDTLPPDTGSGGDTGRTDGGGEVCEPESACCRYWVGLEVRSDGTPVDDFGGVVELGDREIPFQCPEPTDAPVQYRCDDSPFAESDDADSVESRVWIDVGPRSRSDVERVDVHLASADGSYEGPVDVSPRVDERRGGETCRSSSGTVSVREGDIEVAPRDFRYGSISGECLDDGQRQMTVTLVSDKGGGCSAQTEPCLIIELTGDDLPSADKRHGAYRFGPDQPGDKGEVCRNGRCQSVSGVLYFKHFFVGEAASGHWRIELPSDETMESRFSASNQPVRPDCD